MKCYSKIMVFFGSLIVSNGGSLEMLVHYLASER